MSVLVPFAGSREDGREMAEAMASLAFARGDEGVVADNSPDGALGAVGLPPGWQMVRAEREGSPAHTRNTAALAATRDWLLFLDSDTLPPADLLERFFARPIPGDVGVIGGRVLSDERQSSVAARWAESRGMTAQESHMIHPFRPYFLSACLLTRRAVWQDLGGFYEGIFNGEDVDFCWRAQDAGWRLSLNDEAAVVHLHRESVKDLAKQAAVRGASAGWVYRRWPQARRPKRPGPLLIAKGVAVSPVMALIGQRDRAQLRALDVTTQVAERWGTLRANRARPRPSTEEGTAVEVWCDEFPLRGDDAVASHARELARRGHSVTVVAARRPDRPAAGVHDVRAYYIEDETPLERLGALARLVGRRPPLELAPSVRRLAADPGAEVHVDPGAALAASAQRAAALAGRPCRVERLPTS